MKSKHTSFDSSGDNNTFYLTSQLSVEKHIIFRQIFCQVFCLWQVLFHPEKI